MTTDSVKMDRDRVGTVSPLRADGRAGRTPLDFGLSTCQVVGWEREVWTTECALATRRAAEDSGIRITAFWCGWPVPKSWDLKEGPDDLGVVPKAYREMRVRSLRAGGQFAIELQETPVYLRGGGLP